MTISPVDNSLYFGLIDTIGTFPTKESLYHSVEAAYTEADSEDRHVDLSNYYNDPETTDMFTQAANNVMMTAENLDNAMKIALEHGMSVEDAVNVNCAMHAYKASCYVAKSTFELEV